MRGTHSVYVRAADSGSHFFTRHKPPATSRPSGQGDPIDEKILE